MYIETHEKSYKMLVRMSVKYLSINSDDTDTWKFMQILLVISNIILSNLLFNMKYLRCYFHIKHNSNILKITL
jgi:hypothetical protein